GGALAWVEEAQRVADLVASVSVGGGAAEEGLVAQVLVEGDDARAGDGRAFGGAHASAHGGDGAAGHVGRGVRELEGDDAAVEVVVERRDELGAGEEAEAQPLRGGLFEGEVEAARVTDHAGGERRLERL